MQIPFIFLTHYQVPVQDNYFDCGTFTLHFIDISNTYFRRRITVYSQNSRQWSVVPSLADDMEFPPQRIMRIVDFIVMLKTELVKVYESRTGDRGKQSHSKVV
jgi:hypothetical protein